MPIVNRTLDPSQRKETAFENFGAVATGVTLFAYCAPFPCEISAVDIVSAGLSGAPVYSLERLSFVTGAGLTTYTGLAVTLTVAAYGTSGAQGFSLLAPGSTLIQLFAGDVLTIRTLVSNTAVAQLAVSVVVKALQDIKSHFGVST